MEILFNNIVGTTIFLLFVTNFIAYLYSYLIIKGVVGSKNKIQSRELDFKYLNSHLPLFVINVSTLMFFVFIGLYFEDVRQYIINVELIASPLIVLFHLVVILLFDDTFFYFLHKFMHENKYVYKKIHKIHHRANSPIPIDYIYVHPLEWMSGFIGPFIGIVLLGGVSIYTFWLYLFVRNFHEIAIHSGIKTSFLYNLIPFYGTNEHHDYHHAKRDGNYSSTFTFWDYIYKTKL